MLAVVAVSIPIFVRFGLYRAVIRFIGHKAVFAVAFAVGLSGVLLGLSGSLLQLARAFVERGDHLLVPGAAVHRRVALCGSVLSVDPPHPADRSPGRDLWGGEAGARLSTVLSTTRAFDPLVFIDDNRNLAWTHGERHQGLSARGSAGADQGAQHRSHPAGAAFAHPATAARDLELARAAGRACADGARIRATGHRQGERRGHPRSGCLRPPRSRFRAAEGGLVRRVHSRSGRDGDGRGRLHRLGALPADHRPGAETAGAIRDVRAGPLQHRARAAHLRGQNSLARGARRAHRQRPPEAAHARDFPGLSGRRRSTTRRPTSTCRSSSKT